MHRVLQHAANAAALLLGVTSAGAMAWAILVSGQGDNLAAFGLVMIALLGFSLAAAAWAIADNAKLVADFREAVR